MKTSGKEHTDEFRTVLRMIQITAGVGIVYSAAALARETAPNAEWRYALYTTWFAIAILSVEAILRWIKAGVYALLLMTLVVGAVEILEGVANLGGASLGLLVVVILVGYLYPLRDQFD
jgi:hypothetical protein